MLSVTFKAMITFAVLAMASCLFGILTVGNGMYQIIAVCGVSVGIGGTVVFGLIKLWTL